MTTISNDLNILASLFDQITLSDVVTEEVYDLSKVPPADRAQVIMMALHCCMNGPVGVSKQTNFKFASNVSIAGKCPGVSNKSWAGFCSIVATYLKSKGVAEGHWRVAYGDYWPLAQRPPRFGEAPAKIYLPVNLAAYTSSGSGASAEAAAAAESSPGGIGKKKQEKSEKH